MDQTQIILAVIAILGTIVTALLTGIGAILLFVGKYFVDQVKSLQSENKQDRDTHYTLMLSLAKPIADILENNIAHTENTKASLDSIESISEKIYNERHKK